MTLGPINLQTNVKILILINWLILEALLHLESYSVQIFQS